VEAAAGDAAVIDVDDDGVDVAQAVAGGVVGGDLDAVVVAAGERAVDHVEDGNIVGAVGDDVEAVAGVGGAGQRARRLGIGRQPARDGGVFDGDVVDGHGRGGAGAEVQFLQHVAGIVLEEAVGDGDRRDAAAVADDVLEAVGR